MSHARPASPAHGLTLGFTYTPAGQIASNARSNGLYRFNATPPTTTETPKGLNQLAVRNGTALSFDLRGNMTHDGERGYIYSSEDGQVRVWLGRNLSGEGEIIGSDTCPR